jgi:hypothetical protein
VSPELQRRWKSGEAPFDGMVVATCDEPGLAVFLEILSFAVERLRQESRDLSIIADWHEHDGFLTNPIRTTWSEFATRLSSPESLYQSRDSDDYVRIGLFPDSFEWLLRYNIEDAEQDCDAWCDFDFSCTAKSPFSSLISELNANWPGYTDVSQARQFFDNSYGG